MSEVFLSYRQTDDEQLKRVRAFGERLRGCAIDVILDQFFMDINAGGPNEGWPQWSSDRASKTEYVLIIGTDSWFQCFAGTQQPGTGLGAASEARVIRQRIYDASGVIDDIRIVRFGDATIPTELRGYHHFHPDRDFESIVRWLGGTIPIATSALRTSIPHNLPSLQPFFGRDEELKKIADALDPESRTWGALINGPGGIGKTSLAIRAAYDASAETFDKIILISLKSRVLDDDGERDLSGFLISGLAELLNELARELDHAEIAKAPQDQRPRMLHDVLRGTRALLVLDNLESLVKRDRDIIFTFVEKLPLGCKAILTARGRIGSGGKEIILEELSEEAALATVAKLAESNSTLQRTNEEDRINLYRQTGGNPLLLRWTAGQIGRGSCLTLGDAIRYLRSCPEGNDPLEFIFGNLVESFSEIEALVLCVLTFFTLPAKAEHIFELARCAEIDVDRTLRSLVNRSLVVPSEELTTFTLVPLVADFLRKKIPDVLEATGDRLEKRAIALVIANGFDHKCFSVIETHWPIVVAALPRLLAGPNPTLQVVCSALFNFCIYYGRYDEALALYKDAERIALASTDFLDAGWCAQRVGCIHHLRLQAVEVLACSERAEAHWRKAKTGMHEQAVALHLRGLGHDLANDTPSAIAVYSEAVEIWRALEQESKDVVIGLNALGGAYLTSGEFDAAERTYNEALRIALILDDGEGVAIVSGNLALLALDRQEDYPTAEARAREALSLAESFGRPELIAAHCEILAETLIRQGKKADALPYAQRAVDIFTQFRSPDEIGARNTLGACES
jgi:tetratricopeptide (TPR) repeat protein